MGPAPAEPTAARPCPVYPRTCSIGYGHDQGDAGLLTEVQTASFMTSYFAEFKGMMQRAKAFGKPVIIVLEGDSFGMLSLLTKNDPTTKAAVASTGMPELAGLPDTIAGIGLGYLAIRKSVGATNVFMGPDTPYYAAKSSPAYDGRDTWSASDSAPVDSPSINRYVSFLDLYHQTSGRPWMLHQVPIGNSQHTDTACSASTARSGYKDMLVEHLFQYESPASPAIRAQHLGDFAKAGVVGMLFGFSDDGDAPTNDLWTDGKPFFSTHVDALVKAGGFPL